MIDGRKLNRFSASFLAHIITDTGCFPLLDSDDFFEIYREIKEKIIKQLHGRHKGKYAEDN